MSRLFSFLLLCYLAHAALVHRSKEGQDSSLPFDGADVGTINISPLGRPTAPESPAMHNDVDLTNVTAGLHARSVQLPSDQATQREIDVRDCSQLVSIMLCRDDLEDPQTFDTNKTATWTYGTCTAPLKLEGKTNSLFVDTFDIA